MDSHGTELVNSCKDELGQTSARIKLSDLNESWGDALSSLSTREEKLKEGLVLAQKYQVCCSCSTNTSTYDILVSGLLDKFNLVVGQATELLTTHHIEYLFLMLEINVQHR